jgi:hypothetical protein
VRRGDDGDRVHGFIDLLAQALDEGMQRIEHEDRWATDPTDTGSVTPDARQGALRRNAVLRYPTREYQADRASRTRPGDRRHDQQKTRHSGSFVLRT